MISSVQPRFVLIGAGGISRAYAQAFLQGLPFQIVGIVDTRPEAAQEVADMVGTRAFTSITEMVEQVSPDAAIVCTPPSTHPDICIQLMQLGIHVLCEKPLAISSGEAQRMADAAEQHGVVFTMGSKFRFVADVQNAKQIIESGALGEIILFENTFAGCVDMSQRWNSQPAVSGGGVLIDNGTHSVDILRFLLGSISELQVVEGRRVQQLAVEDTVHLFVRTTGGVLGSIDLSWSMNKVQPHFISIYGSAGSLFVGWKESRYRTNDSQDWNIFGSGYDKLASFANQLRNFAAAIRGSEELIITPDDALASVRVIESAYAALRTQKWHRVTPERAHRQHSAAPLSAAAN